VPLQAEDTTAASLKFEVVSIKRNKEGTGGASISSPREGDNITITNMSPHMLIGIAFNFPLHDEIYGLPGWTDQEAYDILAKVPADELPAFHELLPMQRNPMLQEILVSRFHLKYHYDTRALPGYALVVGKKGARLVEGAHGGANNPGAMHTRHGEIIGDGVSTADLARVLSQQIGRPIADETGLKGAYNFKLNWTPDMDPNSTATSTADSGPSIFTAVQEQLGLRLESAKVPVRVLVVDHIDRPDQD
jgi:uncharacterized protein (TIGR03435 family)